jgi:enoyl-CoA hydratase/carnithine racemase
MGIYRYLSFEKREHIGLLTLRRPEVMNALNREITAELHSALDELPAMFPMVRVLVLTGEGRGFCSGADLSRMGSSGSENRRSQPPGGGRRRRIQELALSLRSIPQPVVAAVNGAAAGAGLSLALACDIRIASESARFSSIFVKRGLVPDTAASTTIAAIAGHAVAAEMSLTGRIYDAQWALSNRLVSKVVPAGDLMDEAMDIANEIASNPPLAVRQTKKLLRAGSPDWHDTIQQEDTAADPLYGTRDQDEAVQAFLEKRRPEYTGE